MVVVDAVAELVHDDVREDRRRRDDEPPVEGESAGSGARAPPGELVANRDALVRDAELARLVSGDARQLCARLLSIPRVERRERRHRKREPADPDDIVPLKSEVERLRRLRQLTLEPGAMLEQQRVDLVLRRAPWDNDFDVAQYVYVNRELARAPRHPHRNLDRPPPDLETTHASTVGVLSDNARERLA